MASTIGSASAPASPAEQAILRDIRQSIISAIDTRARYYERVFTWGLRWKDDDTCANKDFKNFEDFCKILNLPKPYEQLMEGQTPGWDVNMKAIELANLTGQVSGRSLLIMHYAGHGFVDQDQLKFKARAQDRKVVPLDQILLNLVYAQGPLDRTDIVIILDCCQAGFALRDQTASDRIVEFVASVREDQAAFGNPQTSKKTLQNTFTARLVRLASLKVAQATTKGAELTHLSMVDLISDLAAEQQNKQRVPEYKIKVGLGHIDIPRRAALPPHLKAIEAAQSGHIKSSSFPEEAHPHSTRPGVISDPQYMAVFKVEIEKVDLAQNEPLVLIEWIKSLNPALKIRLDAVYRSRSITLLMHCPMRTWYMLDGRTGFDLVAGVFGDNMLEAVTKKIKTQKSVMQGETHGRLKENIPLGGQKKSTK